jgi:hypothetical protein
LKESWLYKFFKRLHLLAVGFAMVLFVLFITSAKPLKIVVSNNNVVQIEDFSDFNLVVQANLNEEETDDIFDGTICFRENNLRLSPKQLSKSPFYQPAPFNRLHTKKYLNSDLPPPLHFNL